MRTRNAQEQGIKPSDTTPSPVEVKVTGTDATAVDPNAPAPYVPKRVRPNRAQRRAEVYKRKARGLKGIF